MYINIDSQNNYYHFLAFYFLAAALASASSLASSSCYLRNIISFLKRANYPLTLTMKSYESCKFSASAKRDSMLRTCAITASSSRAHSGVGKGGSFFFFFFFTSSFFGGAYLPFFFGSNISISGYSLSG